MRGHMKTKEEIIIEFKADLAVLLAKYDAEISVLESYRGYSTVVDGIEFSFDGKYDENGDTISEYGSFNIGTWANKDSI